MANDVGEKLRAIARRVPKGINLGNAPDRYMDHSSLFAGRPEKYMDAWGYIDKNLPHLVKLDNDNWSDVEALKTLAHEGTHSKQVIARNRRELPDLSDNLKENIRYLMETNPKFLRDYLGHADDTRKFSEINNMDELMSQDEVGARLQAIEAMLPKGQMLEHSEYSGDLFSGNDEINAYLSAMNPEGFVRNDTSSFREIPNQTAANPNKGILDLIKGLINK